jgi:hypothetical protein
MVTSLLRLPLILLIPLLGSAAMADPVPARPPERFSEEMEVREVVRVVALPAALTAQRVGALGPESFQVLEDGQYRTVLAVSPLPDWTQVIYLDRSSAGPEAVFRAALALAGNAGALSRRGPVAVFVADPEPRQLLAPSREPARIAQVLTDLAGQARVARDRGERPPRGAGDATFGRGVDQLVAWATGQEFPLPTALLWAGPVASSAAPEVTAAVDRAGHALAAAGLTVVPLEFDGPASVSTAAASDRSDLERFRDGTRVEPPSPTYDILVFRVPLDSRAHRQQKPLLTSGRALDAHVRPELAPQKALAEATAGLLISDERQIPALLDRLGERYQVVYSAPKPPDGHSPRTEITLIPEGFAVRLATGERRPPS